jgi:hypothetical protein
LGHEFVTLIDLSAGGKALFSFQHKFQSIIETLRDARGEPGFYVFGVLGPGLGNHQSPEHG